MNKKKINIEKSVTEKHTTNEIRKEISHNKLETH
jgi:hypothetical protein